MASILIVDDDPMVRRVAKELLLEGEHAIVEARDGDLVMKIIDVVPVDLVVVDLLTPDRGGLEVIQAIRMSHPQIRIIAVSSGGRTGARTYRETARVYGADAVMAKPLRAGTFANAIDQLLDSSSRHNRHSMAG